MSGGREVTMQIAATDRPIADHLGDGGIPLPRRRSVVTIAGFVALGFILLLAIFGPMLTTGSPIKAWAFPILILDI